jgi:hypothetical protein
MSKTDTEVCDPEVVLNHPALVVPAPKREVDGDCKGPSTHKRQNVKRPEAAEQLEDAERSEDQTGHRTDVDPADCQL